MKMKKLWLLITLVVGLIAFAMPVQAASITYSLNTSFPGADKPNPDGTGPWLYATFEDVYENGDVSGVRLTLTSNLSNSNKVGRWYFNLNPLFSASNLNFVEKEKITDSTVTIKTDNNKLKAGGDGYYDIEFDFTTGYNNSFGGNDSIIYLITSSDAITAESFNFFSEPSGGEKGTWLTAAHIQSITKAPGSTWIGAVPIPSTILLLGSGLIGIAVGGKKIFKKIIIC